MMHVLHWFTPSRWSISIRLTVWYGLTLLVLLSLFAIFSYATFHVGLHRDFDQHLVFEKRELMPFLQFDGSRPTFTSLDEMRTVAYRTDGIYGTYVRLLSTDGTVLWRSPNFEAHVALPIQLPDTARVTMDSRTWEGKPARVHYTPLFDNGKLRGWLEVSGFEWSLHRELYRLGWALVVGIVLSVGLSGAGGYWLARRVLRPVAALTASAREIGADDLSERLPTQFGVRDELTDLAKTFNDMMDRLEASFERERRFTDNAAHELLTPLTTLRSGLGVTLRRKRDPEKYREAIRSALVDVDEMTQLVRGLLQLSRLERQQEVRCQPVDVADLARQRLSRFTDRARAKDIQFQLDIASEARIQADPTQVGEVIDNLLDNALKYTPEGGRVALSVSRSNGCVQVQIADTGVGLTDEEQDRIFDRFYRADQPEVQAQSGSGLGLAIVQTIVRRFGGKISVESSRLGPNAAQDPDVAQNAAASGAAFVVTFPALT
jgi:signal transduction histidine kinase